jgi:hypothetical protein
MAALKLSQGVENFINSSGGNSARSLADINTDVNDIYAMTRLVSHQILDSKGNCLSDIFIVLGTQTGGGWNPVAGEIEFSGDFLLYHGNRFRVALYHEVMHAINDIGSRIPNTIGKSSADYIYNEFVAHSNTIGDPQLGYRNMLLSNDNIASSLDMISMATGKMGNLQKIQAMGLSTHVNKYAWEWKHVHDIISSPSDLPKLIAELKEFTDKEPGLSTRIQDVKSVLNVLGIETMVVNLENDLENARLITTTHLDKVVAANITNRYDQIQSQAEQLLKWISARPP